MKTLVKFEYKNDLGDRTENHVVLFEGETLKEITLKTKDYLVPSYGTYQKIIKVLSPEESLTWLDKQMEKYASNMHQVDLCLTIREEILNSVL